MLNVIEKKQHILKKINILVNVVLHCLGKKENIQRDLINNDVSERRFIGK